MTDRSNRSLLLAAGLLFSLAASTTLARPEGDRGRGSAAVIVVKDGAAQMTIRAGSVKEPVEELKRYLEAISGAKIRVEEARAEAPGIQVGLAADFPWFHFEGVEQFGKEGFLLRSDGKNLFLIAREPRGVEHAVATFLYSLGCRWYFPGKVWEVIPKRKTIAGNWNDRSNPSFALQRKFSYGFGSSPVCSRDLADWERHNRMGGPLRIAIGHTWHGLDPKGDFEKHPEWFALVQGKRQPSKPCYSHPEVLQRATQYSLQQAAKGAGMISMTPPDGLGYCECERCRAVCRGGEPYQKQGTTFARRPDGVLVSVASETLFQFVNQVAAAVAKKYPKTLVGCYAYSAYSHPPSFKLHPNVFLQTTTAFRRTPLSLAEQLETFHKIGVQAGIRAYYSVYQWDWDYPAIIKGEMMLPRLVDDLRFYYLHNVQSVNAEASCNWAARGLGYYLAARLMWNVREDPQTILADFYDKAFGPAALPMERYYVRWLGRGAAIRTRPTATKSSTTAPADPKTVKDELDNADEAAGKKFSLESLKAAYRDLDEAARLVTDRTEYRARVDQLRLYAHYLYLRTRVEDAAGTRKKEKVIAAVKDETVFGARLQDSGIIHSRPLIGKEFYRRFRSVGSYLEGTPEWPQSKQDIVRKSAGQGYRRSRTDVPGHDELEKLWQEDKKALGIR
ncbi:MAG TPA: DUF4838 domain-containing protein [Gemmataceae bacterium]|nr:DUF4838 domain-containing protein [Gemmataceae bacterium]